MAVVKAIICDGCPDGYAILEHKWSQERFSGDGWSFEGVEPGGHERRDFCIRCTGRMHNMADYFPNT